MTGFNGFLSNHVKSTVVSEHEAMSVPGRFSVPQFERYVLRVLDER
ncbi:MAG: hypothetical protein ACXWA3_18595 [Acidimicrobiales bacterium]